MPKARTVNPRDVLPVAALDVIAKGGWIALSIEDVAKAAKMTVPAVQAVIADKPALLGMIVAWVDAQSAPVDEGQDFHDQVFEALMARIDVMQGKRAGFTRLIRDVRGDPCGMVAVMPGVFSAMNRVAGSDILKSIGITAVYAATLRIWMSDESEDLSATMAELDRRLSQAERIAGFFKLQS